MSGTLRDDKYTCMIISPSVLLRMRNVSDAGSRRNENTFYVKKLFFFFFEYRAVYEIMRKNIVEPGRPQMTVWRMRIACWLTKVIHTHSDYVGDRGSTVVKVLCYKPEGRWFDPSWCQWIFH